MNHNRKKLLVLCFLISLSNTIIISVAYTESSENEYVYNDYKYELDFKNKDYKTESGIVLSIKNYSKDITHAFDYISPIDVVVGIGYIKDNIDTLNLSYDWGYRNVTVSGIPEGHSDEIGNIHMIGKNSTMDFSKGDKLLFEGDLVDVDVYEDSEYLHTYTTSDSFGGEDCIIMVLKDIRPEEGLATLIILIMTLTMLMSILILSLMLYLKHKRPKR